jgi:molybdopterin molybdotransferase
MITPDEATKIVLSHPFSPEQETISLLLSQGRISAEAIIADSDLPPFPRVMMDGVAFAKTYWDLGQRNFDVEAMHRAGDPPLTLQQKNACIEVMTGAVCPSGCDVVVPYEQLIIANGKCNVLQNNIELNQHIQKRGSDKKQNDILVPAGCMLESPEIGIGASAGKSEIKVYALPRVHVFSTGEELVDISDTPLPHQIRRSNVFALQQLLLSQGIISTESHLPDEYDTIYAHVKQALDSHDLVLLTGGVSKGKFDLIPQVMKDLGVEELFHRIAQKPGKPMWFGATKTTTVFAFPGNPVSTFMCAVRYLLPWLRLSMTGKMKNNVHAKLGVTYQNKNSVTFFQLVKVNINDRGELIAEPISNAGSGDFSSIYLADGFLEIPAGASIHEKGAALPLHLFRSLD